jgi:protease-4
VSPPPPPPPRRGGRSGCLLAFLLTAALVLLVGLLCAGLFVYGFVRAGAGRMGGAALRIHEEHLAGDLFAKDKVAVIELKGLITSGTLYDGAAATTVCRALAAAAADPAVKAVVLDIDSPGGEITASDEIHHAVQRLRTEGGKPVVACMHAMGASGAYFVAAAADHIVANRLTITGSIGVIVPHYVYHDLLAKLGVAAEPYTSGEMKDMLSGARANVPPQEPEYVRELVQESFREFAQVVADGRQAYGSLEAVTAAPFADGRILTGREAHRAGLVDEIGYFEDAVAKAQELGNAPTARVVRFGRAPGLAQLLFSAATAARPRTAIDVPDLWTRVRAGQPYYLLPSVLP